MNKPIVAFLGHIDSGKTTIIEKIISCKLTTNEAYGITENIASYEMPSFVLLDTLGHSVGNIFKEYIISNAYLVCVVVSIVKGLQVETSNILKILADRKKQFAIILNKADLIPEDQLEEVCLNIKVAVEEHNIDLDHVKFFYSSKDKTLDVNNILSSFSSTTLTHLELIENISKQQKGFPYSIKVINAKESSLIQYFNYEVSIDRWYTNSKCFKRATNEIIKFGKVKEIITHKNNFSKPNFVIFNIVSYANTMNNLIILNQIIQNINDKITHLNLFLNLVEEEVVSKVKLSLSNTKSNIVQVCYKVDCDSLNVGNFIKANAIYDMETELIKYVINNLIRKFNKIKVVATFDVLNKAILGCNCLQNISQDDKVIIINDNIDLVEALEKSTLHNIQSIYIGSNKVEAVYPKLNAGLLLDNNKIISKIIPYIKTSYSIYLIPNENKK